MPVCVCWVSVTRTSVKLAPKGTDPSLLLRGFVVAEVRQLQLGLLDSILMEQFVERLWDGVA